jgi:hypothetical protein
MSEKSITLHHYTSALLLPSIAEHGLIRGCIPFRRKQYGQVVWFTTSLKPDGHGIDPEPDPQAENAAGKPNEESQKIKIGWVNKHEIRMTFTASRKDPNLHRWKTWAKNNGEKDLYELMRIAGGKRAPTWYFYRGKIASRLLTAFDLRTNQQIVGWPNYQQSPIIPLKNQLPPKNFP